MSESEAEAGSGERLPGQPADGGAIDRAVAERTAHLSRRVRLLDVMDRIARITPANTEIDAAMGGVLDEVLEVFGADRAWFVYPCDPDSPTWSVPLERTRPDWPGAHAKDAVLPMTPDIRETFRQNLASREPLAFGPSAPRECPPSVAGEFSIRSQLQVTVRPRTGPPWVMGIHHCAEARAHDEDELFLFKAIADRVSETLSSLIVLRDLRESNERFRTLAEEAPVGIYVTDARGDCTFTNRLWRATTGLGPEEDAGSGWARALHPDDREVVQAKWYGSVRSGRSWRDEYRFLSPSGKVTWVEGTAFPLKDEGGAVTGYVGTNVDITERKQIEAIHSVLVRGPHEASQESFFEALARFLAENLRMDFVCIDRLERDGLTARTTAVWRDGAFRDNFTYALSGTPCGELVGKEVCCFPAGACQLFPRNEMLRELRAESYAGVTLWDDAGLPIGLIAVIGRRPLADRSVVEATLKLVSVRTAGEMERMRGEEAVRERIDELSRWHRVTLGREERILELKREVNELLAASGLPPRYTSADGMDCPGAAL